MVVLSVALLAAAPLGCQDSLIEIRSALQHNDTPRAAALLEASSNACATVAEFFELQGVMRDMSGDAAAAEKAFGQAVELPPKDPRYLEELGATYLKHKNAASAVSPLKRAVSLNAANDTAKKYLAAAYVQNGNWGEAATLLDELANRKALTPKDPILLLWFAQALVKTHQLNRLDQVTKDLAADPPPLLFELGHLFAQNGLYEKAIACFSRIPAEDADEAVYFDLGLSYSHLRFFDKARESYYRSIDRHIDYVEAYFRVGVDYGTEGKTRLAVPWLLRAHELAASRADVSYALAEQLILLGYYETASSLLVKASESDPGNEWLAVAFGDLNLARGQIAEAAAEYERTLATDPLQAAAMVGLARTLIIKGDENGAATHLRRALVLRPDDPIANRELGTIEEHQQQWPAAHEHLTRARREGGPSEAVAVELSRVERHLGHAEDALKTLQGVASDDRQSSNFHLELAQVYQQLHKTAAAESERSATTQTQAGAQGQLHFEAARIYVH